jgi:hypothetical protein
VWTLHFWPRKESTKKQLLTVKNLPFTKVLEIVKSQETTTKDSQHSIHDYIYKSSHTAEYYGTH